MSHHIVRCVVAAVCGVSCVGAASAFAESDFDSPVRPCEQPRSGQVCEITIDRKAPQSTGLLKVWNSSTVSVHVVNKSPFEACWSEGLLDPSVAQDATDHLLTLLTRLGSLDEQLRAANQRFGTVGRPEGGDNAAAIEAVSRAVAAGTAVRATMQRSFVAPLSIGADLFRRLSQVSAPSLQSQSDFIVVRDDQRKSLVDAVGRIQTAIEQLSGTPRSGLLQQAVTELSAARAEFGELAYFLSTLDPPEFDARITMVGGRNQVVEHTIVCADRHSGRAALRVPVSIVYGDVRGTSVSAGLVVSPLSRPSIETASARDPSAPGGVAYQIFQDSHAPQMLPFLFLNIESGHYSWRGESHAIEMTVGAGLGFGSDQPVSVELFTGPSLRFGGLRITPGVHIGRQANLTGGFRLNDPVPANFVAPVTHVWRLAPAIAFSYRLPLLD